MVMLPSMSLSLAIEVTSPLLLLSLKAGLPELACYMYSYLAWWHHMGMLSHGVFKNFYICKKNFDYVYPEFF
jgi:hypothetical protein